MLVILLTGLNATTVWGEEIPPELQEAMPADAEQLLDGLHGEFSDHDTLVAGFALLRDKAGEAFFNLLRANIGNLVLILGVVLLCGVIDELHHLSAQEEGSRVNMAGALAITVLSVGSLRSLIGLGRETVETMDLFAKTLLPTLSAAVAASGGVVSAGANQIASVFFANLVITIIRQIMMPLALLYVAVAMADAALAEHDLKGIRVGIGKIIIWGLTALLSGYVIFLKLSGAAGMAADSTALHLAKTAISAAVPVVGGIVSEATGTVTAGAELLKASIGVFGTLGVLSICLLPFVHLAVQFVLYKLTAFMTSLMGSEPLVNLLDAIGTVFGLVLAMVGACGMVLLIAIISAVSVVIR